jgi:hypothetical protein
MCENRVVLKHAVDFHEDADGAFWKSFQPFLVAVSGAGRVPDSNIPILYVAV